MTNTPHTIEGKKDPKKDTRWFEMNTEHIYTEFNKEVASLLTPSDVIVFGPAEDFEYKAPLEDFKKSRQVKPH